MYLYWFSAAAITIYTIYIPYTIYTNIYHKASSQNDMILLSHSSGGRKSKIRSQEAFAPSGGGRKGSASGLSPSSQWFCGLWQHRSDLHLVLLSLLHVCVQISLLGTLVLLD